MSEIWKAKGGIFMPLKIRFDLKAYEEELWQCKGMGIPLMPVPDYVNHDGDYQGGATQFKADMEVARMIYERVKNDTGWKRNNG